MSPAPVLTTDAYLKTPETLLPAEVIFGVLRVADAPTVRHQQAVGAFYFSLALHVRERRVGKVFVSPLDVIFDYARALILQPDLVFISNDRDGIVQERVIGSPDMVLEVLSPNPRIGKLQERIDWFAAYGVREIWLLHQQDERFEILGVQNRRVATRESYDYARPIRSRVLPDFRLTIDHILRE